MRAKAILRTSLCYMFPSSGGNDFKMGHVHALYADQKENRWRPNVLIIVITILYYVRYSSQ